MRLSDKTPLTASGINQGFLIGFILTVGLGAVNFGYSLGVFNSMLVDFFGVFKIDKDGEKFWKPAVTAISPVGAAIGCLFCGPVSQRLGKKLSIHLANVFLIIGCLLPVTYADRYLMLVGRFIFGLSAGAFSVFVPSFINEITPVELKGPCGTATQILINLGILLADLMGLPLPEIINGKSTYDPADDSFVMQQYWRVIVSLPIPLAILQSTLLLTVFNFETPRYLLQNNRLAELTAVMGKLYASDQVQKRIRLIEVKTSEEGEKAAAPSYKDTLCSPQYSTATLVGCLLAVFQQLSGINIVIFYSSTIMTSSGLSPNKITVLVGAVYCLGSLPTVWLFK